MWLIVGLGNPGRKYQNNRHNIGFHVVDELARRHDYGASRDRFGGHLYTGALSLGGRPHKALLLKPMEFMNLSGFAIQRTAHFYDLSTTDMIVIHDEIDIDFGRLKLKQGGGHGGHNGLRSIVDQLGRKDFLRVRVGVGKPGPPPSADDGDDSDGSITRSGARARAASRDRRVSGHVLSDFPSALSAEVDALVGRAADATEMLVSHGLRDAMNRFHGNPG